MEGRAGGGGVPAGRRRQQAADPHVAGAEAVHRRGVLPQRERVRGQDRGAQVQDGESSSKVGEWFFLIPDKK